MRTDRRHTGKAILGNLILILFLLLNVFPVIWMVVSSLKDPKELFSSSFHLLPQHPTLENFTYAFSHYEISSWFVNSILSTIGISLGETFVSVLAAFALTYFHTKYNSRYFLLFIATMVIPFQVTMIPNYVLISRLGLLGTLRAVIFPNWANATTFYFLYQHMRGVPVPFYDAASIEGADSFWIFRNVAFRLCQGAVAAQFIICFIEGWNQYFWPLLVLNDVHRQTLTIGLQQFLDYESGNLWGPFMATATIASLPMIAVYLCIQKQIVEAFVSSGLKG